MWSAGRPDAMLDIVEKRTTPGKKNKKALQLLSIRNARFFSGLLRTESVQQWAATSAWLSKRHPREYESADVWLMTQLPKAIPTPWAPLELELVQISLDRIENNTKPPCGPLLSASDENPFLDT